MERKLICTLCNNACPLDELGCLKGQRFYERTEAPYCTLCENHCLLSALLCAKGKAFYDLPKENVPVAHFHQPKPTHQLSTLLEICSYQFRRVRGASSSQMRVLRFLHNHGSITQRELQFALNIKSATMSEIISKMDSQGLIARTQSQKDKRVNIVQLTDAGEEAFLQQAAREEQMDLFSALSPDEQALFIDLLERLNEDWREREETAANAK